MPTAEHYRDLIDSTVNQVEDGFSKTVPDGLRIHSAGSSLRLLSLYQGAGTPNPSWVVEHGDVPGALHLRPDLGRAALLDGEARPAAPAPRDEGAGRALPSGYVRARPGATRLGSARPAEAATPGSLSHSGLSLTHDGRVGVSNEVPDWRLDVGGVARMSGRIGAPTQKIVSVPADGKWHDITHPLTGCQAFEVMAGAGGERYRGRYSMLHAIAMNAFHPRNPILNWLFGRREIRTQTAVYGSYADRLRLRWVATGERHYFKLQLRTNANFGSDRVVRYYLTRLWFDSFMQGSDERDGRDRDEGVL
nr:hypothetical protein [Paracoccus marinaquae]